MTPKQALVKKRKSASKTGKTARCMTSPESSLIDALLDDLQSFCAARRGRVVALADALGVVQPQVSAWLARRFLPSGEATLQMQAWLARERAAEAREHASKPTAPPRLAAALKAAKRADSKGN